MIDFLLDLLGGASDNTNSGWSGGRGAVARRRGPLAEEAFHQGRLVLRADMEALRSGQLPAELAEPAGPAQARVGRRRGFRSLLLVFLVLWALCTLLVMSWSTGDSWSTDSTLDTIGSILGWLMILLMSFFGAFFVTVGVFLVYSLFRDGREHSSRDQQDAAKLRHAFWQEREELRGEVAHGTISTDQLLTTLRGAGGTLPPLIGEMVRPDQDER